MVHSILNAHQPLEWINASQYSSECHSIYLLFCELLQFQLRKKAVPRDSQPLTCRLLAICAGVSGISIGVPLNGYSLGQCHSIKAAFYLLINGRFSLAITHGLAPRGRISKTAQCGEMFNASAKTCHITGGAL
jgi:hypothetical protein